MSPLLLGIVILIDALEFQNHRPWPLELNFEFITIQLLQKKKKILAERSSIYILKGIGPQQWNIP